MNWISRKFLFVYKYSGKWISKWVNQRRTKEDAEYRILLYCNSSTMEEHLVNYVEQTEDEGYHYYVFFGDRYPAGKRQPLEETLFKNKKNIFPVRHMGKMFCSRWDLIVCADLEPPFWMFKGTIPMLYIGHGISNVSYDGGKSAYDYGPESRDEDGRLIFGKILEPNKRVAKMLQDRDDEYKNAVCRTGYRFAGKIAKAQGRKDEYRSSLGIDGSKPVVSFFGSWNKESLFHVLGKELFEVCDALSEKYTFIFSIHPIEYSRYSPDIEPMGELVERQREKGHLVRSPKEDWVPYIMASDVVVADYSTMLSLAILAGKRVILSDFPDTKICEYSLGYQVKKSFPVIGKAGELEEALRKVLEVPEFEKMVETYREELYVSEEEYKEKVSKITADMIAEKRKRNSPCNS